jgi:riboflavin synthase
MFTGIVEAHVSVRSVQQVGTGARVVVPEPSADWGARPGDSISTSGCCLTVVELVPDPAGGPPGLAFDLSAETLDRTWLGDLRPGSRVNLERAARLDTRLGGHLVSGHVDGVGRVTRIDERGDGGWEMHFEVPEGFERYLIEKGSITVDGVSLTVVAPRGREFHVALIPETLRRTTLGSARVGTRVHLEADQIGKWIERLLEARR